MPVVASGSQDLVFRGEALGEESDVLDPGWCLAVR